MFSGATDHIAGVDNATQSEVQPPVVGTRVGRPWRQRVEDVLACEVDYRRGVPSLRNDDRVLEPAVAAVRNQFGDVVSEFEPSLGGEDFALMADLVPSFQLRVGSSQPGRNDRLHNSAYQPDESCIGLGVQALSRAALELLA